MRQDLRWKFLTIIIFFAGALFLIFNPFSKGETIRFGLDLKGGIELVLEADYRLGTKVLSKLKNELIFKMREAALGEPGVSYLGSEDNNRYDGLVFKFSSPEELARAQNMGLFKTRYQLDFYGETKNLILTPNFQGEVAELKIRQDPNDYPKDALKRALTIIDNRISQASSGMAEADVRLDNQGRINVQLPGLKSMEDAQAIITATGRLTFRINNRVVLDGTDLKDITYVNRPGEGYALPFSFKGNGAKQLAKITADNVGKNMAVYLDEQMLMDPVIKSALPDGSGEISLGLDATREEAERYAILMKSGSLPVSLKVAALSQVAPTLGKEIVNLSGIAMLSGIILVMIFMVCFYKVPGLIADVVLIFYATFVLGIMVMSNGVLTLPGIAGIILSIGMAVDANIIIFERIKDELRNGKRMRSALEAGFNRAFTAILDSNVTTLIAAIVLLIFGSGPVQGFGVTLTIGVLTSMLTAIFVTRIFLQMMIDRNPDKYAKYFGVKEVA